MKVKNGRLFFDNKLKCGKYLLYFPKRDSEIIINIHNKSIFIKESDYYQGIDLKEINLNYENKNITLEFENNKNNFSEYRFYLMAFQFESSRDEILEKLKKNCFIDEKLYTSSKDDFQNYFIYKRNIDPEYHYILNRKNNKKKFLGLIIMNYFIIYNLHIYKF